MEDAVEDEAEAEAEARRCSRFRWSMRRRRGEEGECGGV